MRKLAWGSKAWKDYLYWQSQDKKTLKRINQLIKETLNTPFEGIGKPEPLRENLSGFWSRRIDETNRLVYAVDDKYLTILSCRYINLLSRLGHFSSRRSPIGDSPFRPL